MTKQEKSIIELRAESLPFIEHTDYEKCGQCLKEMLSHQVAKEMVLAGKIDNSFVGEFFKESDARFKESYLYKEIHKLKKSGKTIQEAVNIMEEKGYIP